MRVDLQKKIHEIETIYDELEFHLYYFDEARNGKFYQISGNAFDVQMKIECFVASILTKNSPLFHKRIFGESYPSNDPSSYVYKATPTAREFAPFGFILFHLDLPFNRFNLVQKTYLDVLNSCYSQLDFNLGEAQNFKFEIDVLMPVSIDFINHVTHTLRLKFNDTDQQKSLSRINATVSKRFSAYCQYIDELLHEYTSLTFLCMEFSLFDQTNPNLIHDFKKTFFNNGRSNKGLSDMVGYIGKWEFSQNKGYYFRAIFIFPSETVVHCKTLSIQISDYWIEDVTNGNGVCHHAMLAARTLKLKKHSCTIDVSDKKTVDAFKDRVVGYITKSEKFYMPDELTSFLLAGKIAAKSSDKKERNSHNTTFKGTFKPKNTE